LELKVLLVLSAPAVIYKNRLIYQATSRWIFMFQVEILRNANY